MNTSGEAMVSQPAEWCSPIQASSKPSSSIHSISSMSRAMRKRGILADPMERGEEDAERQPLVIAGLCHVKPPLISTIAWRDIDRSHGLRRSSDDDRGASSAARTIHHRRGERRQSAAVPAPGDLARGQDRSRPRRRCAQDRATGRRSGAQHAAVPAAGRKRALPVPQHLQALAGARPRDRRGPRQPGAADRQGRCLPVRGAGIGRAAAARKQGDADRDRRVSPSKWTPRRGR